MTGSLSESGQLPLTQETLEFAHKFGIVPNVHAEDFIFRFVERKWPNDRNRAFLNYYELGQHSANLAWEMVQDVVRVNEKLKVSWFPQNILDFASGYGCVARHLPHKFSRSDISVCDIHSAAVTFNSNVLNLKSFLSSAAPEDLDLPQFDVVFALSFFSHLPRKSFGRWLRALQNLLNPGGALIFTANGYVTRNLGLIKIEPDKSGFGFRPESEQHDLKSADYGITISYPEWVFRQILDCPTLRVARFQEGLWWAVQDTYVCIKDGDLPH